MYLNFKNILSLTVLSLFASTAFANRFVFPELKTDLNCYTGDSYTLNVEFEIVGIKINAVNYDDGTTGDFNFDVIFQATNTFDGIVNNPYVNFWNYEVVFYSEKSNIHANHIEQSFNGLMTLENNIYPELNMRNNSNFIGSASALGLSAHTFYTEESIIDLFGFNVASLRVGAPCLDAKEFSEIIDKPLPITLHSFDVQSQDNANILTWLITKEETNPSFIIERSKNSYEWQKLANINAPLSEIGGLNAHYKYVDEQPINGRNFYRLKILDELGGVKYSEVKMVDNSYSNIAIEVYPNPVKQNLYIKSSEQIINVDIFNLQGQKVLSIKGTDSSMALLMDDVPAGIYIVHIELLNKDLNTVTIHVEK